MSFPQAFLDGWDQQFARGDGVLKSMHTQADFFKTLAKHEKSYSTSLSQLVAHSRTLMDSDKSPDSHREVGSLISAWRVIFDQIEKVAEAHKVLSESLDNDLTKPLLQHAKEKVKSKKKLQSDAAKLQKDWKTVQDKLAKSRDGYIGKCKEQEAADATHEKGKEDPQMKPSALAKLAAKASQAADKTASADNEYQQVLQQTNVKQKDYYTTTTPVLLMEFQKWEESRLEFVHGIMGKFAEINSALPAVHQQFSDATSAAASALSVEEDIKAVCEEQGTNIPVPDDIPYLPFGSDTPAEPQARPVKPAAKPAKPAKPAPGGKGKIGKYQAPETKDVPFDPESYGSAAGVTDRKQLSKQVSQVEGLLKKERVQCDGLESLVKFYASDPAAQKDAHGEWKASQAKVDQMEECLERLRSEAGDGAADGGTNTESDQVDDEASDGEDTGADGDTGAGAAVDGDGEPARGLYDYTATCDTELSFAEGEELTVTDKDDSGWWYCMNADGVQGFVPNNYVELI